MPTKTKKKSTGKKTAKGTSKKTSEDTSKGVRARMLSLEVRLQEDAGTPPNKYPKANALRNDLQLYRSVLKKAYSLVEQSQMAGSSVLLRKDQIVVKPNTKNGVCILECACGHKGSGGYIGYPLYDWLKEQLPGWKSVYVMEIIKDIKSRWKALDAEYTKASRGWLELNGVRTAPLFQRATLGVKTRVKEEEGRWFSQDVKFEPHRMTFSLRKGSPLTFKIPTLEGNKKGSGKKGNGRWYIYKKIQSGEWRIGDPLRITEGKRGNFKVLIPYYLPETKSEMDPNRTLEVSFSGDEESFMHFHVRASSQKSLLDVVRHRDVSAVAAVAALDRLSMQQEYWKKQRESCGSRVERKYGAGNRKAFRAISERSGRLAKQRQNVCNSWNHQWSSMVVTMMERYRCGRVEVFKPSCLELEYEDENGVTKTRSTSHLCGRSWPWADWENKVKYKVESLGGEVVFREEIPEENLIAV